jgi:protein-tyrosine phosphatase
MQARTWWIDEPLVMAASNPMGEDLAQLRAEGFNVVISFLEEQKQPPNYDKQLALAAGWTLYSFPIEEGGTPSMAQLSEFVAFVSALPEGTRILMHCESGLGRTAFMAAGYWITKGLAADQAIERVRQAASEGGWKTPRRESILREFARYLEAGLPTTSGLR